MKSIFLSDKFVNLINEFKGNAIIIPYKCKTALSRARGYIAYKDRVQFTCNPYYGCLYNCKYCYVPNAFAFKHLRIGNINWGKWIIPKVNFPSILLKELKRLENKNRLKKSVIRLSSISDPFPIIEDEFQLTKTTLNTFLEFTPNWIFIQTKSNLILKYLSILNEIKKNVAIGITITTDNKNIIKELKSNEIKNRACIIFIVDDNFFVDRKFVMALCDAIINKGIKKYFMAQIRVDMIVKYPEILKKMANAGFIYLFLGLESFSDRTLEKLNKRLNFKQIKSALRILHDLGYFIQGNIIIGATLEDTKQDIESTIEIAKNLDIDLLSYSLLTPFPGTKLMEKVINDDILLSRDWNDFNWSVPVIKYPHLSSDDLSYYLSKAYKETSSLKKPFRGIRMLFLKRGMKFHISRISPVDIFKLISRMIRNLCKMVSYKKLKKK